MWSWGIGWYIFFGEKCLVISLWFPLSWGPNPSTSLVPSAICRWHAVLDGNSWYKGISGSTGLYRPVQHAGLLLSWSNLRISFMAFSLASFKQSYCTTAGTARAVIYIYNNDKFNEEIFNFKFLSNWTDLTCEVVTLNKKKGLLFHWKHSEIFQH